MFRQGANPQGEGRERGGIMVSSDLARPASRNSFFESIISFAYPYVLGLGDAKLVLEFPSSLSNVIQTLLGPLLINFGYVL